jgi:hypothetical protein
MVISIKPEVEISKEEEERMYWERFNFDSHKWVEYHPNYFRCEFCELIHTSNISLDGFSICDKNPNLRFVKPKRPSSSL